ncbi:MAG TPA: FecR domain-containing protein [Polyangiaceae bacterium]|nr:FecR domain-containing protein [Polyangiaceae bacterium]HMR76181.1 FecR domain-containing protein [Polyangiaceae bacterium]
MSDNELDQLLGAWRRSVVPLEDAETEEARRARVVPQLARQIRAQAEANTRERSRRRRAGLALLAVAAVIAAVFGFRSLTGRVVNTTADAHLNGDVVLTHAGTEQALASARNHGAAVGDSFTTLPHKSALLSFAGGATAKIAGSSRVSLVAATPARMAIRIDVGEVRVRVPKLAPGGSFEVLTPDTTVTVHGTEFTVRVSTAGTTSVVVHEGRVSAKSRGRTTSLIPGADPIWTSANDAAPWVKLAPPAAIKPLEPTSPAAAGGPRGKSASPRPNNTAPSQPAAPETSLAAQNKVYAAALAARDRGNDAQAVALLDELLRRYPDSPLTPEARLERFRALKRLGKNQEAAGEARRYLRESRGGAAQDEARDVAMPKQ